MICAGSRPPSGFFGLLAVLQTSTVFSWFWSCWSYVYTCAALHVQPWCAWSSRVPAKLECVWQKSSVASFSTDDHVCFKLRTRNSTPAFLPILKCPVFLPVYCIYSDLDLVFGKWMTCFKDDRLDLWSWEALKCEHDWNWAWSNVDMAQKPSQQSVPRLNKA